MLVTRSNALQVSGDLTKKAVRDLSAIVSELIEVVF